MDPNYHHFQTAYNNANERSKQASLAWIRTVISILTPSLVLLIGLQEHPSGLSFISLVFLVVAINCMTVAILSGLYVLRAETIGHKILRNKIADSWNNQQSFPESGVLLGKSFKIVQSVFYISSVAAIITIAVFGTLKYVT